MLQGTVRFFVYNCQFIKLDRVHINKVLVIFIIRNIYTKQKIKKLKSKKVRAEHEKPVDFDIVLW